MTRAFHMIDVGDKIPTRRVAVAQGSIHVGAEAFALIKNRQLPKGDALVLAEVAGIQGAKRASDLIPLCHPMLLDHVVIRHELDDMRHSITVYCLVATFAKTGVEMEAMAGVQAALLTIYDLAKMIEPALTLKQSFLLAKTGGKKGTWLCPEGVPEWVRQEIGLDHGGLLDGCMAAIVTLSDRAAAGVYEDKSGAMLRAILSDAGATVLESVIIPDNQKTIVETLQKLAAKKPHLIVTTGGTGISSRDVTPEAVQQVTPRLIPGIGELLRQNGARFTRHSWSSRSIAAVMDESLIIALPGSPKAVKEGMDCLLPLLPHLLSTIAGKKHDQLSRSA